MKDYNMRCGFKFCIVLFLCLTSIRAMAMAENYVSVSCGNEHVIIASDYAEPPPVYNPDGFDLSNYGQASECKLKSGDIVRVRMGFDYDSYHYDQVTWVSVWFYRMKWLSRIDVEVSGPHAPRAKSIDVSKDGVRVCTVLGPILSDVEGDGAIPKPSCKYTARAQLANTVDVKEPEQLDNSKDPLNPPVILMGQENPMCEAMASMNKDTRLNGTRSVEHLWLNFPEGQPIRISQNIEPNSKGWYVDTRSDFENAGSERHVYYRPVISGPYVEDLYVLLDDDGYSKYVKAGKPDGALTKYAEAVWPMDWAGAGASKQLNPGVTLTINTDSGETVTMLVSRISILPFKYKGKMYLLLADGGDSGYAFVIRPHAKGKFDQVCVFTAGTPNF